MARDQVIFERTVQEAIRRASLLFAPRRGNQSSSGNASSTQAGLVPPVPADATKYLSGSAPPVFQRVIDSDLLLSDVTSNNVSIAKHGFAPKAPNDVTKYLDGTGAWSTPAGVGGALPAFPTIADLKLRCDLSVSALTLDTSGLVSQFNDVSGNGFHFTPISTKPQYFPKRFNGGYPCIRIKSGARMSVAGPTLAQPFTIVVVAQNALNNGGNQHLYNVNGAVIGFIGSGPEWFIYAGGTAQNPAGSYTQTITDLTPADTTRPTVMSHVYNGASSLIRENGTSRGVSGTPGTNGLSGTFYLGGDSGGGSLLPYYLYAVLVYGHALSAAEMLSLEQYYGNANVAGVVQA